MLSCRERRGGEVRSTQLGSSSNRCRRVLLVCGCDAGLPSPGLFRSIKAAVPAVPVDAVTLATEPTSSGAVAAVPVASSAAAPAAAVAAPPKQRSLADDILGDLYSLQPVAPAATEGGGGCAPCRGFAVPYPRGAHISETVSVAGKGTPALTHSSFRTCCPIRRMHRVHAQCSGQVADRSVLWHFLFPVLSVVADRGMRILRYVKSVTQRRQFGLGRRGGALRAAGDQQPVRVAGRA